MPEGKRSGAGQSVPDERFEHELPHLALGFHPLPMEQCDDADEASDDHRYVRQHLHVSDLASSRQRFGRRRPQEILDEKIALARSFPVHVGVDTGKTFHVLVARGPDGRRTKALRVVPMLLHIMQTGQAFDLATWERARHAGVSGDNPYREVDD